MAECHSVECQSGECCVVEFHFDSCCAVECYQLVQLYVVLPKGMLPNVIVLRIALNVVLPNVIRLNVIERRKHFKSWDKRKKFVVCFSSTSNQIKLFRQNSHLQLVSYIVY